MSSQATAGAVEAMPAQPLDDRFRLRRVRLRGIFAVLFDAEQYLGRTLVRPVQIKVSRQTGLTDVTAPHFLADAVRLAQGLPAIAASERRHLPALLDLGISSAWNQCGFCVWEACAGTPLLQWTPEEKQPDLAARLAVFQTLCRTLATVHRLGVAHGELRPEAVVVDAMSDVKVLGLGLTASAEPQAFLADAAPDLLAHLAPEWFEGRAGPAADVYGLGLIMYEWLTGSGPHLTAPWSFLRNRGDAARLKQELTFAAPSVLCPEIRAAMPWLDDLVLRCLEYLPAQRFRDAGQLLEALEACAAGKPLPAPAGDAPVLPASPLPRQEDPADASIRTARRHLARGEFRQAIDQLDVHRPAEWAVVDGTGARLLRVLGQAYVRQGDWRAGRECLEQLRSVQRERQLLAPRQYGAALSDLLRCYERLDLADLAAAMKQEMRALIHAPR